MTSRYVFHFPYRGVGGVPVLFLRIAEYITNTYATPCYVVDYCDGFMAKNKKNPLIQLIPFEDGESFSVPDYSILILQSDLPWGIPQNIKTKNTKIFFWNCYPFNLIPTFPSPIKELMSSNLLITKLILNTLLLPSKIKTINFLKQLEEKKALTFMDGPNLEITEYSLGTMVKNPQFLPIFIRKIEESATQKNLNTDKNGVCFSWVGRVADFKIHILNRVLQDCFNIAEKTKTKIEFLIVGSGNQAHLLFKEQNEYFTITSIPYLAEEELNQTLKSKVDCLFAMGTSALEGAKLKVPTILLDFSYGEVKEGYKYNFLFESKKFSLGDIISAKNFSRGHEIQEILKLIKEKREELAKNCLDYFLSHHELENNMGLFIEQSKSSILDYNEMIANIDMAKPFFYRAWALIKKLKQ